MNVGQIIREILGGSPKGSEDYGLQLQEFIASSGASRATLEATQASLDVLRELNRSPEANLSEILPLLESNLKRLDDLAKDAERMPRSTTVEFADCDEGAPKRGDSGSSPS